MSILEVIEIVFVIIYSTSCSGIMGPVDEMLKWGDNTKE